MSQCGPALRANHIRQLKLLSRGHQGENVEHFRDIARTVGAGAELQKKKRHKKKRKKKKKVVLTAQKSSCLSPLCLLMRAHTPTEKKINLKDSNRTHCNKRCQYRCKFGQNAPKTKV